jgi:DNA-binding transcriptional LysR family regulator
MDRLDLRLVEYFIAVAEELHFGRAAQRLHIAQPSLSQQIRQLEQQLGVALFERTTRRVELTSAGEALLREGRRTITHARRTMQATRAAGRERLVVGFSGSAANGLLPGVLQAFARDHPSIDVSLRELGLGEIGEVGNGNVDVAFTRLLPGQVSLEIEILAYESRAVALAAGHRLANRESLTFAELQDEDFVTNPAHGSAGPPTRWLAEQRRHGLPGRVAAEAATVQEILTLVAAGRGVCLVPESVASHYPRADVRYVKVADADPAVVSLAWNRENERPALEAFREAARTTTGTDSQRPARAASALQQIT